MLFLKTLEVHKIRVFKFQGGIHSDTPPPWTSIIIIYWSVCSSTRRNADGSRRGECEVT